ncbi:TOM (translocase of outer membrane) complex component [Physocladia obscura]|uniref:TOM (Translocase of outer membrane) complex component n=1 Tax=Physocladia obscura TaxID=109957 RepID=A0AAD5SQA6_9FUNG|nr:TOM (translocase of outer membrane) complex component [Physocladia obscura]
MSLGGAGSATTATSASTSSLTLRTIAVGVVSVVAIGVGVWLLVPNGRKEKGAATPKGKAGAPGSGLGLGSGSAPVLAGAAGGVVETVKKAGAGNSSKKKKKGGEAKQAEVAGEAEGARDKDKDKDSSKELARARKEEGNRHFGAKDYAAAIAAYTAAIALDGTDAVFYANRAACHANLGDHAACIADATAALRLDARYVKALYRRAQALAASDDLQVFCPPPHAALRCIGLIPNNLALLLPSPHLQSPQAALHDYTAICMLEEFQKDASIQTTDKVLRDLGEREAARVWAQRDARLPSLTFIKAYMDSFRPANFGFSVVQSFPHSLPGDAMLHTAYSAIMAKDWENAMSLLEQTLTLETSSDAIRAFALNSYATFCFLKGDITRAMENLEKSILLDPHNMNTLIKRASIFMERQDLESALRAYETAEAISKTDPDLYYHRGQVRFLTGDINAAIADYRRSLELDNDFVYAHIQLAVAQYKNGDIGEAEKTFTKALKLFSSVPEVFNYYGEVLLDMEKYDGALEKFDRAIEMDPISPLPYINKSILYLQWKRDPLTAEKFCRRATEVDATCDIAYIQLAQLLIHQNRLEDALAAYDSAIAVTRTEAELVNAISCREACAAQLHVSKMYPDVYAKLRGATQGMSLGVL